MIQEQQLHKWYLEAFSKKNMIKAKKSYHELDEEQKDIYKYIAQRINMQIYLKNKDIQSYC